MVAARYTKDVQRVEAVRPPTGLQWAEQSPVNPRSNGRGQDSGEVRRLGGGDRSSHQRGSNEEGRGGSSRPPLRLALRL